MKKPIILVLLLTVITACNAPKVAYDYDDQINYKQFGSYSLYPELESGLSMLDEDRLLQAVQNVMRLKGISQSSSPDLYLNIFTQQHQERSRNNLGVGISGGRRGLGVGISGGIPVGGTKEYLIVYFDLIDVSQDQLIWQAEVSRKFNANASPQERRQWFVEVAEKAFSKYPPK